MLVFLWSVTSFHCAAMALDCSASYAHHFQNNETYYNRTTTLPVNWQSFYPTLLIRLTNCVGEQQNVSPTDMNNGGLCQRSVMQFYSNHAFIAPRLHNLRIKYRQIKVISMQSYMVLTLQINNYLCALCMFITGFIYIYIYIYIWLCKSNFNFMNAFTLCVRTK